MQVAGQPGMIQVTPQMRILVAVEPADFRKGSTGWPVCVGRPFARIPSADTYSYLATAAARRSRSWSMMGRASGCAKSGCPGTVPVVAAAGVRGNGDAGGTPTHGPAVGRQPGGGERGSGLASVGWDVSQPVLGKGWFYPRELKAGAPLSDNISISSAAVVTCCGWTMGNLRKIKRACQSLRPLPAPPADGGSQRMELDRSELEAILERAKTTPMSEAEYAKLHAVVETLVFLTQELEKKHVSIQRLKQLLFGATTETTRKVIERILDETGKERTSGDEAPGGKNQRPRRRPPGTVATGPKSTSAPRRSGCRTNRSNPGMRARTVRRVRCMRAWNRATWCESKGRRPWGPRCTNCRSYAATCAGRSSQPGRRRM